MIPKGSEEMKQVETRKLDEKEEGESVISALPPAMGLLFFTRDKVTAEM